VKSVKAVRFAYNPTPETRELLRTFRLMVNDAIRIGLNEKIKGRFKLRNRIYRKFRRHYGVLSCYPYSVAEVAWSILKKNRRWHRKPFASRLMAKMDSDNYSINCGILSLPNKRNERLLIPLQYGEHQRSFLGDKTLKRGSVTITESTVIIAFSKETTAFAPARRIGYDLNHKSIVGSDGTRFDLSNVARLHTEYGVRRSRFSEKHPNDRRLKQKYTGSRREKERIMQALSRTSKRIVEKAIKNGEAIILERLKGIRKAHQKGNMKGRDSRRRANLWPFRLLQHQIAYKATWAGVPVEFVNPRNTSKECANCHYVNKTLKVTERSWLCPLCGCRLDRDLNAAVNIERRGKTPCLGEVRPGARGTDEAVKGNDTPILQAEAPKFGGQGLVL
jgi:putative transposase